MSPQREVTQRFTDNYARGQAEVHKALQREVFGGDTWVWGYTTIAQADLVAERLRLRPGIHLLDVGAGLGWPSLHLAARTGCRATLTDVPAPGLRQAMDRSQRQGVADSCSFVVASGTHLPFRPRTFDAIVHTDAL